MLNKIPLPSSRFFPAFAFAFLLLASPSASADDGIWTGGGTGSGDPAVYGWGDAANWDDGDIPGVTTGTSNTDTATFGDATNRSVAIDSGRVIENLTFTSAAGAYSFSGETLHLSHGGQMTINGLDGTTHTFDNNFVLQPENATSDGLYTIRDSATNRNFVINGNITGGTTSGRIVLRHEGDQQDQSRGVILGSISDGGAAEGVALELETRTRAVSQAVGLSLGGNTHSGGTFLRWWGLGERGGSVIIRDDQAFGTGVIDVEVGGLVGAPSQTNNYAFSNTLILRSYLRADLNNLSITWNGPVILDSDTTIANAVPLPGSGPRVQYRGTGTFNGVISEADPNNPVMLILQPSGGNITFNAANTFSGGLRSMQITRGEHVALGPNGTLGTGNVIIPFGNLLLYGGDNRTVANHILLDGRLEANAGTIFTFTGGVTVGTGATSETVLNSFGSSSGGAIFRGVMSDGGFNRPLNIWGGDYVWAADNALTGTVTLEGGTLQIGEGGGTGLIGTAPVVLGGSTAARAVSFNRTGSYTVENAFSNAATNGGSTLTFEGGGTASLTGTSTWTPHGSATNALVVANGTTVLIDGSHTAAAGGYLIQAGATLGGSGSIALAGIIDLASGAFLRPGSENAPGTLNLDATLNLVQLQSNSGNLIFRLGSASDQLVNDYTILYNTFNFGDFEFIAGSGFGAGTYDLMVGTFLGDGLGTTTTGTINGLEAELVFNGSTLSVTVIPEPATVAALLGALALGLAFWRRTRANRG